MVNGKGYASKNSVDATTDSDAPTSGQTGAQGEVKGVGSTYAAVLNERENLSNMRNQGPERTPSAVGASRIPVVGKGSRKTGRK